MKIAPARPGGPSSLPRRRAGARVGLLVFAAAISIASWQHLRHAELLAQFDNIRQEQQSAKKRLEQRAAESRAALDSQQSGSTASSSGDYDTQLRLARERAAATSARLARQRAEWAEKRKAFRRTLANSIDNPDEKRQNRELRRNELKAALATLVRKLHLSPEQAERLLNTALEGEFQSSDLFVSLLRDDLTVAEALGRRDTLKMQLENSIKTVIGEDGYALYDRARQEALLGNANRVIQEMSKLPIPSMTDEESKRLREILRAELAKSTGDDFDVFRPARDLEKLQMDLVDRVTRQSESFLSPVQVSALRQVGMNDLEELRRKIPGMKANFGLEPDGRDAP